MPAEVYAAAAGEFFGAVKELASLVPNFGERRQKEIDDETGILLSLEKTLEDRAVSFKLGDRIDEVIALSEMVTKQKRVIENKYILFNKQIKEEKAAAVIK